MKGFSENFSNFPDYILGITKEIWEDRGIGTLHAYYSNDIIVRSPGSLVIGNGNVIGATMATLGHTKQAAPAEALFSRTIPSLDYLSMSTFD